jgi:hypothetical protein
MRTIPWITALLASGADAQKGDWQVFSEPLIPSASRHCWKRLAVMVRGADTARLDLSSRGTWSLGLSRIYDDDLQR